MIFIWKGWGIVVPIVWFVSLWIIQLVTNSIFGTGTYESYGLFKIIGSLPAGFAVWVIGNILNENISSFKNKHAFFFLPIEYWGFIIPVITLLMVFIF